MLASLLLASTAASALTMGANAKSPSKKDFIAKAEGVCATATKAMSTGFFKLNPAGADPDETLKLKFVNQVLLPNMTSQFNSMFKLELPSKDKDVLKNIQVLANQELANLRKHPDDALFKDPFNQTNLAMADYGMKGCLRNQPKQQKGISNGASAQTH